MKPPPSKDSLSPQERRERYRENQNYFSEKLSEVTRYVGFGLVAFAFSLLSDEMAFAKKLSDAAVSLVAIAGLCGCLVVLSDFLHLMLGWKSNELAAGNKQGDYAMPPAGKRLRAAQTMFFYLKQGLAAAGSLLLIGALASAISIGPLLPDG
ncbi:MAG TPA: hypothetical protein VF547_10800 [Allosphingosinicella sp.]|jgi:hypothetical protein